MAVRLNAARRQLTDAQKVLLGQRIEPDIAAIARAKMLATLRNQPSDPSLSPTDDSEMKKHERTTDHQVAKAVGLGGANTYYRHKKVIDQANEEAPELLPFIENGDLSITTWRVAIDVATVRCYAPSRSSTEGCSWSGRREHADPQRG